MTDPRLARPSTTVAWTVYGVQMFLTAGMALMGVLSVFLTDSCGSVEDEPAVCDTTYFGTVLFGYWFILAVLLVAVPIVFVRAARRGDPPGRRAVAGLAASFGVFLVFLALMTRG